MATPTPEQVVHGTSAEYGIVWNAHHGNIVPHEFLGNHPYSAGSARWSFDFGEGCVGHAYAKQETLIIEDDTTGDSMFMRKSLAKSCGINTIAFVPQPDGSVLEVGFQRKLGELPKSWWMKSLMEGYTHSKNHEIDSSGMRTPSAAPWLNKDMAPSSLKALAQVAVKTNELLAHLQPSFFHVSNEPGSDSTRDTSRDSSRSSSALEARLDSCEHLLQREPWEDADSSDIDWEDMPKPLIQLDLLSHLPGEQNGLIGDDNFQLIDAPHDASMPQYDAYEPNYLKFIQSVCSLGSVGHPYSCGGACKYMKTQRGCKVGVQCDRCHLCKWTRAGERQVENTRKNYSAGSVGHPHFCGGACKYHTRKECKAGRDCDRCHLCTWTRSGERKLMRRKQLYQDVSEIGHPFLCGECCQYKESQGSTCNHCHLSF
jgi:hypothetical protein